MKRLLTFFVFLLAGSALAAPDRYRVEVLVFNYVSGQAEAAEEITLRSFSHLPTLEEPVLPDGTQTVPEMGDELQGIWRRLRASAEYRPLAHASWEQSSIDYVPPLRLHDEALVSEELRYPTERVIIDPGALDPLAAYRVAFYRLDGSVQLRRSRFLHLDIDFEFREALPQIVLPAPPAELTPVDLMIPDQSGPADDEETDLPRWQVIRLNQSRQVRTGEWHYFDSSWLGVVARITKINPSVTDTP